MFPEDTRAQALEMLRKLYNLRKGDDPLVYYSGFLDNDRRLSAVQTVADVAYKLYEEGKITLKQKRRGEPSTLFKSGDGFDYIAEGLRR